MLKRDYSETYLDLVSLGQNQMCSCFNMPFPIPLSSMNNAAMFGSKVSALISSSLLVDILRANAHLLRAMICRHPNAL